jgi:hypothetical protein
VGLHASARLCENHEFRHFNVIAELLSQMPHPQSQSNLPESGQNLASHANRAGGAERCADPAVPQTIAVDVALLTSDATRLPALARSILKTAQQPEANTLSLVPTGPGMGKILRRGLRSEIPAIARVPRVQAFASAGRLRTCAQEAAGNRVGPAGTNIGPAPLPGAWSEATPLCRRHAPDGPRRLARLENTPGPGNALPLRAHQLARAAYYLLTRKTAFDRNMVRRAAGAARLTGQPRGLSL